MPPSTKTKAGTLYIVATPIGNLEDITLRAIRTLREVDRIAAEDTRHTKKLLNSLGINTPLISYYREKEQQRGAEIIRKIMAGENIALVSDAGTPAISDPGAILVQLAHEAAIKVSPIPGPSALTAALSGSGFSQTNFLFLGFPPAKQGARKTLLKSLIHIDCPLVFYQSARRVITFLKELLTHLGDRQVLWARELTKNYEELERSNLAELVDSCGGNKLRGEFVLIIGPAQGLKPEGENLHELLRWYRDHSELSMKDACRKLAGDLGLSRSQVYQQALTIYKEP